MVLSGNYVVVCLFFVFLYFFLPTKLFWCCLHVCDVNSHFTNIELSKSLNQQEDFQEIKIKRTEEGLLVCTSQIISIHRPYILEFFIQCTYVKIYVLSLSF